MKWTQERQDAAIQLVADMAREFSPEGYLNHHAVSQVAFELACQRNELLEACKRILPQSLTGNPTLDIQREYWEYEKTQGRGEAEDVLFALAAISKAEGK